MGYLLLWIARHDASSATFDFQPNPESLRVFCR